MHVPFTGGDLFADMNWRIWVHLEIRAGHKTVIVTIKCDSYGLLDE